METGSTGLPLVTGPTVVEESADRLVLSGVRTDPMMSDVAIVGSVLLGLPAYGLALALRGPRGDLLFFLTMVGLWMLFLIAWLVFVHTRRPAPRAWIFEPGRITRRTHVPLLGLVRERHYPGVKKIELRDGVWDSGRRHAYLLRFRVHPPQDPVLWVEGHQHPVDLEDLSHAPSRDTVATAAVRRELGSREYLRLLEAEMAAGDAALGARLAARVGVPLERIEECIVSPRAQREHKVRPWHYVAPFCSYALWTASEGNQQLAAVVKPALIALILASAIVGLRNWFRERSGDSDGGVDVTVSLDGEGGGDGGDGGGGD